MNFIKGTIVGTEPGARPCYISMHTHKKYSMQPSVRCSGCD